MSSDNKFKHIAPRREMIDPAKEVGATVEKIRSGLSDLDYEIASTGRDPDDVYAAIKKSQDKMESLGLILKSNPKYTTDNGTMQVNNQVSNDS